MVLEASRSVCEMWVTILFSAKPVSLGHLPVIQSLSTEAVTGCCDFIGFKMVLVLRCDVTIRSTLKGWMRYPSIPTIYMREHSTPIIYNSSYMPRVSKRNPYKGMKILHRK
jgi:hypothetical protein